MTPTRVWYLATKIAELETTRKVMKRKLHTLKAELKEILDAHNSDVEEFLNEADRTPRRQWSPDVDRFLDEANRPPRRPASPK
jgi:hypothetical protein